MPLFGGKQRPKLDGLTKEEENLRDALNPEVLRRAGEKGVAGQAPAAAGGLGGKRGGVLERGRCVCVGGEEKGRQQGLLRDTPALTVGPGGGGGGPPPTSP